MTNLQIRNSVRVTRRPPVIDPRLGIALFILIGVGIAIVGLIWANSI